MKSRFCSPSAMPVRWDLNRRIGVADLGLVETLGNETHHFALMVLVRAEDVEEFKPGPLRRQLVFARDALDDGDIEHVLAEAVEVHRLEPPERGKRPVVGKSGRAVTVSGGRGGVYERRAGRRAPVEQPQRQPEIIFHDEIAVGRGGRRDGAHMHHRVELATIEPARQVRRRNEFGELAAGEVAPFAVIAETVADGDVRAPGLVEARDHVRSDEAGPAGDQQHRRCDTA